MVGAKCCEQLRVFRLRCVCRVSIGYELSQSLSILFYSRWYTFHNWCVPIWIQAVVGDVQQTQKWARACVTRIGKTEQHHEKKLATSELNCSWRQEGKKTGNNTNRYHLKICIERAKAVWIVRIGTRIITAGRELAANMKSRLMNPTCIIKIIAKKGFYDCSACFRSK